MVGQDKMEIEGENPSPKKTAPTPPPSALRNKRGAKIAVDKEALAALSAPIKFRVARPMNTLGDTICTISSRHADKTVSPTVKVFADIKLVFELLKRLDPSTKLVAPVRRT